MSQQSRNAARRGLSVRSLISVVLGRPAPAATAEAASLPATRARALPRLAAMLATGLLAMAAVVAPAAAQQPVMTITGATPSTYSGPGELITFHVTLGGSNAVTSTVELTRIAYGTVGPISCVGLPLEPLESTTCSFSYVTQPMDVFGLNQSGTFKVTTLGAPRTRNIANSFVVPYVPVPPTASIVANTASVTEDGAQTLGYTVTLNDPAAAPISVYFSLGGSANGADYTASANPLVIATGSTTGTITIDPTADTNVEADETVTVSLVAGSGYTLGAPTSATGTITNDDLPSLSINDVSVTEGNAGTSNATFTVSLAQPAGTGGVGFDIATANGTATAGADYVATSLVAQTIPAGSSTYSFTVTVNGDMLNEPNENFFVNVTNVTNAVVADGQGIGTITNDDALPSLSIAGISVTEGNAGTSNATFTVSLSAASGQTVTVNYATADGVATAPGDYTATSGTLSFSPGVVSRTLTVLVNGDTTVEADETFNVNLSGAVNSTIATASGTGTIVNDDVVVTVTPASLPNPIAGSAYSQVLGAAGGTAPYTFAVTAGALPAGLTLSSGGALGGTATAGGAFNFTVTATDANGVAGSRAYALTVNPPTITIAPPTVPAAAVAAAYNQGISAAGGVAPYSYAVTAGALPPGLSLAANGNLSGTPTAGGTFNFTVRATDSTTGAGPYTGARAYSLTVNAPTVTLPATTLADGVRNTAYSATINPASGGTAPYTYAITSGALPAGMTLAANGTLGGTPMAAGTFVFGITASDSSTGAGPYTATRTNYSLTILADTPVANPVSATVAYGSSGNPITLSISGGIPTSVATAAPPAHGSVAVSGNSLTYTPNTGYSGPDSFTYTASNSGGTSAAATVTITVTDPVISVSAGAPLSATVGSAYSQTFTWNGGAAPYSGFAVSGLPTGLAITGTSANSVTVAGTPTASGSFILVPSATDSSTGNGPFAASQAFTLSVSAPVLALTPVAGVLTAPYNAAYALNLSASGGTGPYIYSLAGGSLPTGLTLTPAGLLSGTPTVPGTYPVAIRATDSSTGAGAPFSVINNYSLAVTAPVIVLDPATLPDGDVGTAYSAALSASGGAAPYSYSLLSGALPVGVSFSSAGLFSGTPRSGGSFSLAVRAIDANGQSGTRAYTFSISAPILAITPATLPAGTTNIAYSASLATSGGIAPYSYSLVSGSLPVGMSFTSAGVFSGTPTSAGTYPVTVRSTDDAGYSVDSVYTIAIDAPVIVIDPATLADGDVGIPYSASLSASGGAAPYSYSLLSGALPVGMSFSSAGQFAGTPRSDGSFSLTVRATDANGNSGSQAYTFSIAAPTLAITPATLPAGTTNIAYSASLATSGGIAPYSYSLVSGSLPVGVSFTSAGVFSGTPTTADSYTTTVRSTDDAGYTVDATYTITIEAPDIVIDPATLGTAIVGDPYAATLAASGGAAPYAFTLESGALPPGIGLDGAGGFNGTPGASGTFNFSVRATDSNGNSGTRAYTLRVDPRTLVLAPASLGAATGGTAYSATFSTSGGIAPYTYVVSAGALPAGISLANGVLDGIPTTSGNFSFDITVTDSTASTVTGSYTLVIAADTLVLDPAALPDGIAGTAYTQTVAASGGIAPYTYAVASGALPTGLSFTNGTLSGTPTASGSFTFDVTATDSTGGTAATTTRSYTLVIAAGTLSLDPATLPNGIAGIAYSQAVSASGGIAPYSYALTAGALPAGLSFTNGTLSGTPTASGSFTFAITATDSTGGTAATTTRSYTLVIAAGTLSLDPAALPDGIAGVAYNQVVSASGGIAPYSYALTAGALPAGLSFADGTLSGTPTASGTFTFDLTASDSTAGTAATVTRTFILALAAPTITLTPATLPEGVRGTAYAQALAASGGTAPYAFALSGGALPAGTSLAADGTLAGTPTADGTFNFAVRATDALGFSGTVNLSLVVAQNAPFAVDDVATTLGDAVVTIPVTSNDTGSITSITLTAAPAHGSATVEGLEVVYTPEAGFAGSDGFRYLASGPGGSSAEATVTVTVNPLPVAVSRRLPANAGTAVDVELTEGASGGPFTAATLVSLSPAASGTARIVQAGIGDAARFVLTYTPAAAFSGLATVRFTLGNAYATSAEASIEFDVSGRPDPSQDPEVRALLAAQVASTRRFATAQIDNFQQRLESLHGQGGSRFSNQVSFSAENHCQEQVGRIPGQRCEARPRQDEVAHAAPTGDDAAGNRVAGDDRGTVGSWIGGVIRSGNHDGRGGSAGIDFETDGLSVGADYRVNGQLALGAGLGWGRDTSEVGDHGSRSEGKAYTAALYASYQPGGQFFIDGLMGYQDLSYQLRRYVSATGGLVQGSREGSQWFASVSAGADFRHGEQLQLTPYARLDLARATLDGYTERGDALYALRYAGMDVDTSTGNLGLRVDYRQKLSRGTFSPQLRLEYQHDFQGGDGATLGYADQLSGPFYRTGIEVFDRNRFLIGLGAQFSTEGGLSTRLEYRGVVGNSEQSDHGLMFNLEKRY